MGVEVLIRRLQSRVLIPSLLDLTYLNLLMPISVRCGDGEKRCQGPEGERSFRWVLRIIEYRQRLCVREIFLSQLMQHVLVNGNFLEESSLLPLQYWFEHGM